MLNSLVSALRKASMVQPGDTVTCAVSGGADSMALLFALYLLKDRLQLQLRAAHFNHGLRGRESDREEQFVRDFCSGYGIPFASGTAVVTPGKKGLEAAARTARYAFLRTQPGKIATAHTADDNAETLLMHMLRGTDLKGLGGIAPVSGNLIRPMLRITRSQVLEFLQEYHVPYMEDSSNATDAFLRNRLRHHVMPLLKKENPRFAENVSAMALRLREDEQLLQTLECRQALPTVSVLRTMPAAQRRRALRSFLQACGVKEPETSHIALAEGLVFSDKPSASAAFPGGVTVGRSYDRLCRQQPQPAFAPVQLECPGQTVLPELGLRVSCIPSAAEDALLTCGALWVRPRQPGDRLSLPGGTKSIKKIMIDRKIPAADRQNIPVVADAAGVLYVYGLGADQKRLAGGTQGISIRFEKWEEDHA